MAKIDKIKYVFKNQSSQPQSNVKTEKRKKNALIICSDESRFWATQKEFWNWFREKKLEKLSDFPLTGRFINKNEEKMVVLANTVLNLSCPNHLSEALNQRKFRKPS